jgi:hypothetical protein
MLLLLLLMLLLQVGLLDADVHGPSLPVMVAAAACKVSQFSIA